MVAASRLPAARARPSLPSPLTYIGFVLICTYKMVQRSYGLDFNPLAAGLDFNPLAALPTGRTSLRPQGISASNETTTLGAHRHRYTEASLEIEDENGFLCPYIPRYTIIIWFSFERISRSEHTFGWY
jgi:hypothetical protein